MAYRSQPVASKICSHIWMLDAADKHHAKRDTQKSVIDTTSPPVYAHLVNRSKKEQMLEEKYSKIEYENRLLLKVSIK
jgi:hypothetical protein